MSAGSSRRRAMKKAQGVPLRRGPEKGTTGTIKGPAQSPSLAAMTAHARREAKRLAAIEATKKAAA